MADHTLDSCPLYHPPNGTLGLAALDGPQCHHSNTDDTFNCLIFRFIHSLKQQHTASDDTTSAQMKSKDILTQPL